MGPMFILILKSWCSIIISQGIIIDNEMTRYPIHDNTDIIEMTFFHEVLKLFWTTISLFECKITHELISPAQSQWVGHNWHKFHVSVVHLNQIRNQFFF